jgi:hypothetical protein
LWAVCKPWLMLKALMMLRAADCCVVVVSMLLAEPRATRMVSGLHLDVAMARVGCVPWKDMPVTICLP